jgi:hypothetical protein
LRISLQGQNVEMEFHWASDEIDRQSRQKRLAIGGNGLFKGCRMVRRPIADSLP